MTKTTKQGSSQPDQPSQAEQDLREAIRAALNELGVPSVHYPAPVANAVEILQQALET